MGKYNDSLSSPDTANDDSSCIANKCYLRKFEGGLCCYHNNYPAHYWDKITFLLQHQLYPFVKAYDVLTTMPQYDWDNIRDDFCKQYGISSTVEGKVFSKTDATPVDCNKMHNLTKVGDDCYLIEGEYKISRYAGLLFLENFIKNNLSSNIVIEHNHLPKTTRPNYRDILSDIVFSYS